MLTGGSTAQRVYAKWANLGGFESLNNIDFYYGDERCVSVESIDSNHGMCLGSLFSNGLPRGCRVFPIYSGELPLLSAENYSAILPEIIDILILSLGDDGHIASIMPQGDLIYENQKKIAFVPESNGYRRDRITITPLVFQSANQILVFAEKNRKNKVMSKVMENIEDISSMPARILTNATWLI